MKPLRMGGQSGRSETQVLSDTRMLASQWGWRLFRNNKGAGKLASGAFLRWGLCNDTAELGATYRSADLIGIRPIKIQPHHVGMTLGQFVSIECKRDSWRPSETDEHEIGQRRWVGLVTELGGYAVITNDLESEK
jgi:hypothetical protein